MKTLGFLFIVVLSICGCKKPVDLYATVTFQQTDIPITTGSYWVYSHHSSHDFSNVTDDTIIMKISYVENFTPNRKILHYILLDNYMGLIDSSIGILTIDSFIYYSVTNQDLLGNYKLTLPFNYKKEWIGNDTRDSFRVIDYFDRYSVNPLDYMYVFEIHSQYYQSSGIVNQSGIKRINDILVAKGIGIIQKSRQQDSTGTVGTNALFTLVKYHIE